MKKLIVLFSILVFFTTLVNAQQDSKAFFEKVLKRASNSFEKKECKAESIYLKGKAKIGEMDAIVEIKILRPNLSLMKINLMDGSVFTMASNDSISWKYDPFKQQYEKSALDTNNFSNMLKLFDAYEVIEKAVNDTTYTVSDTVISNNHFYKAVKKRDTLNQNAYSLYNRNYELLEVNMTKENQTFVMQIFDYSQELFVPQKIHLALKENQMDMIINRVIYNDGVQKSEFYIPKK